MARRKRWSELSPGYRARKEREGWSGRRWAAWQRKSAAGKRELRAKGIGANEYIKAPNAKVFRLNVREWERDQTRRGGQRADDARNATDLGRLRPGELDKLRRDIRFGSGERQRRSFNRMLWGLGRTDRPDVGYEIGYHG